MPKYVVFHIISMVDVPKELGTDKWVSMMRNAFTPDTYCIESWVGVESVVQGRIVCLWEAPNKSAILACFNRMQNPLPYDVIYEAGVISWAKEKEKAPQQKKRKAKSTKK
jgi:hypothetical protein